MLSETATGCWLSAPGFRRRTLTTWATGPARPRLGFASTTSSFVPTLFPARGRVALLLTSLPSSQGHETAASTACLRGSKTPSRIAPPFEAHVVTSPTSRGCLHCINARSCADVIGSHGTDGSDGTDGFAVPMLKSLSPGQADGAG